MLDMAVFGQVPGGDVVHLNRHELIHRLALLEILIEFFAELTPSAGLRVDIFSSRGSMEIHDGRVLTCAGFRPAYASVSKTVNTESLPMQDEPEAGGLFPTQDESEG
jgi:hypothetical protein